MTYDSHQSGVGPGAPPGPGSSNRLPNNDGSAQSGMFQPASIQVQPLRRDPFADLTIMSAAAGPAKKIGKDDFGKEPPKPTLFDVSLSQHEAALDPFGVAIVSRSPQTVAVLKPTNPFSAPVLSIPLRRPSVGPPPQPIVAQLVKIDDNNLQPIIIKASGTSSSSNQGPPSVAAASDFVSSSVKKGSVGGVPGSSTIIAPPPPVPRRLSRDDPTFGMQRPLGKSLVRSESAIKDPAGNPWQPSVADAPAFKRSVS